MAIVKSFMYVFVFLGLWVLTLAQEDPRAGFQFPSVLGSGSLNFGGLQLPDFGNLNSNSSALASFLNLLQGFGRQSDTDNEGRKRRDVPESDDDNQEVSGRRGPPRPPIFPNVSSCNYTEQPSPVCASCNEVFVCVPSNLGLLVRCPGLLRHCNEGTCSFTPSDTCVPT